MKQTLLVMVCIFFVLVVFIPYRLTADNGVPNYDENGRGPGSVLSIAGIYPERLDNGILAYRKKSEDPKKPAFFSFFENLFNTFFTNSNALPFNKSIAFLVGVSEYEYYPDLEFVKNDIASMAEFLLENGGFDIVYTLQDENANEFKVREFLLDRLGNKNSDLKLNKEDRLLFYFSGHGADHQDKIGYMLFNKAEKGKFGSHALKLTDCEEWSELINVNHILFIFDCCASGLAYDPKGKDDDYRAKLVDACSGDGSRYLITAGSGGQETFGVNNRKMSVFTYSFLTAINKMKDNNYGFVTISQIFGEAEVIVEDECLKAGIPEGKRMTPRLWVMDLDKEYDGTFLFINKNANPENIPGNIDNISEVVGKGEIEKAELYIETTKDGVIVVDDVPFGTIKAGEEKNYVVTPGEHEVKIIYEGLEEVEKITIKENSKLSIQFDIKDKIVNDKETSIFPGLSLYNPFYQLLSMEFFRDEMSFYSKFNFSGKFDALSWAFSGIYIALTQSIYLDLDSFQFSQIIINPDYFFRFQSRNNFLNDTDLIFVDYIQAGLENHIAFHRQYTTRNSCRVYGQMQFSYNPVYDFNIGMNCKYSYFWLMVNLPEEFYEHYVDAILFFRAIDTKSKRDLYKISISCGAGIGENGVDWEKGYVNLGFLSPKIFYVYRLYLQLWQGFGESLMDYENEKTVVQAGLLIE